MICAICFASFCAGEKRGFFRTTFPHRLFPLICKRLHSSDKIIIDSPSPKITFLTSQSFDELRLRYSPCPTICQPIPVIFVGTYSISRNFIAICPFHSFFSPLNCSNPPAFGKISLLCANVCSVLSCTNVCAFAPKPPVLTRSPRLNAKIIHGSPSARSSGRFVRFKHRGLQNAFSIFSTVCPALASL